MEIRRHYVPRSKNRGRRDGKTERLEAINIVVTRRKAAGERLDSKEAARDPGFRAEVVAEHQRIKEAALQRLPAVAPVVEEVLAMNEHQEDGHVACRAIAYWSDGTVDEALAWCVGSVEIEHEELVGRTYAQLEDLLMWRLAGVG